MSLIMINTSSSFTISDPTKQRVDQIYNSKSDTQYKYRFTTSGDVTVKSLSQAVSLLKVGGIIVVTAYLGDHYYHNHYHHHHYDQRYHSVRSFWRKRRK